METATYSLEGGPITAQVSVGFAPQSVVYDLRVHSPKMQKFNVIAEGVDFDEGDNSHVLPGTLATKDQRVVRCLATVGGLEVGDPYLVRLELFQDDERIGADVREEKATDVAEFADLQIRLIKEAP